MEETQVEAIDTELRGLQDELRQLAIQSGELNLALPKPQPVYTVNLDSACVVIVDNCWSHIGTDGSVQFGIVETRIDETVSSLFV